MNPLLKPALTLLLAGLLAGGSSLWPGLQSTAREPSAGPAIEVVRTSDVTWEQLNPLRGDKSPKAGTLWGNRTGPGPAGFLLSPADGFKSPPHIHNVSYRGVVISGLFHNDDPGAEETYMPAGSFWTQPAGGVHITAAKGRQSLAYIEVEDRFGVLPKEKAFDGDERPVNIDASNVVWLGASAIGWPGRPETLPSTLPVPNGPVPNGLASHGPASHGPASNGPEAAFLWGKPRTDGLSGTLIKLPSGFTGALRTHGTLFQAIIIQGRPRLPSAGTTPLEPGSYVGWMGKAEHQVSCDAGAACVIYARAAGRFDLVPPAPNKWD